MRAKQRLMLRLLGITALLTLLFSFYGCTFEITYTASGYVLSELNGGGLQGITLSFGSHGLATTNPEGYWSKSMLRGTVTISSASDASVLTPATVKVRTSTNNIIFKAKQAGSEADLRPIQIAAGEKHTVALKRNGTVWVWGSNENGQFGDGTYYVGRYIPVYVCDISEVTAIDAGALHTVALKSNGSVWAWGSNSSGQLGGGIGTPTSINKPFISMLTDVSIIAAGSHHNIALKDNNTVWAWGRNSSGQLGDGTNTSSNTPVQIVEF